MIVACSCMRYLAGDCVCCRWYLPTQRRLRSHRLGNCIILKPSELAPATQSLLADLIPKYLDQSAIQLVTGGPTEVGRILESKFQHIFYTGGGKVGRIVATAAAKHLTPVVLELGGQAPVIVTGLSNYHLDCVSHQLMTLTSFCGY